MQAHDLVTQLQAVPDHRLRGRGLAAPAGADDFRAAEDRQHALDGGGLHPRTRVAHRDVEEARIDRVLVRLDLDPPAGRRELERVIDEVRQRPR